MLRNALIATAVFYALAAPLTAQVADEAAIRSFVTSFQTAWNAREGVAVAALYRPDADQILGNRNLVAGRTAIEREWSGILPSLPQGLTNTIVIDNVRSIGPDHAVVNATGNFSGGRDAAGNPIRHSSDRALYVLRRDGGNWALSSFRVYEAPIEPGTAQSIRAARNRFVEAWRRNDAVGAAAVFAANAVNSRPDAADDEGRQAIQKAVAEFLATVTLEQIEFTDVQLDVQPFVAYEFGTFVQRYQPQDAAPIIQRARYVAVWSREPGGPWEYQRFLFNWLPTER
ncbi:MAG: SgcJ/EcaC family oxidoreductase [Planctomycetes bacterium]|nr:SgcJ/EcaC family oxidoreductase [Planctomycetota bacterium]